MRDSTFPTELFEAIIQEVRPCRLILPLEQDDFSEYRKRLYTLCSCARTCRAWAPTSRLCLYSRLIFISTEKKSFELLVRSLDGNPWLQTLVRGLSIIDNDDDYTPPIPRYSTAAGSISHTWALMLMGKLPRLQDIGFALARGLACHTHLSRALRTFSTVTSLSLAWKHSGSFEDLLKLILVFPALRNLMIHGSLWTPNGRRELHVPPRRHFPRLTALTIESEGQDRVSWTLATSSVRYPLCICGDLTGAVLRRNQHTL
ncbi:hypothetical protein C8Q70DRAFT_597016 [Cubamyces menziesii]|nr:hypothetical protein C8Q70DRAFT_597016 [Cubamyces menziesii]